ncbi:ECF RNA polymerase sigma-E factor [Mycovorax composti]|uniref:ECF RNA polymerase sigma-E factor n=2 Tax=Chitinophagaceae TaxID=563835 RepID=A0ABZ2EIA4_9BACT
MLEKGLKVEAEGLLKLIDRGDEAAFAKLYTLYSKRLTAFSISILQSSEMAEEVVEDVFVKLWNKRGSLVSIDNISVYLYIATKNQTLSYLSDKAKKLITAPFDDLNTSIEAIHQDPHSLLISSEMLARVNAAIEALPPRCKMIFKLIREDGLKYKEVAAILNISVNTIDAQMAIAVKRICQAMGISKNAIKFPREKETL